MTLTSFWVSRRRAAWALLFPLLCSAQSSGPLTVDKPIPLRVKQGGEAVATLKVRISSGYHVNTNAPLDQYLIPLRLTWDAAPLEAGVVEYPQGKLEKYQFSEKPLSVYSTDFDVVTKFKAPANAPKGSKTIMGKLRYQACTTTTCYPPKTIAVELPVEVR